MNTINTEITIDAYNRHAEKFADKFMDFKPYKEKITLFQQGYLSKNAHILDVGCGPGNNARLLMELDASHQITGIDLSTQMITIARENAPGCDFFLQNIRDIGPGKKYDAIIASFCINHLSDKETAVLLQNISKRLKENGTLYLSFMEGKTSGFETTSFSDDDIFFNYYKRHAIKTLLLENSIETIELLSEGYQEQDGSVTNDIFIFAKKI